MLPALPCDQRSIGAAPRPAAYHACRRWPSSVVIQRSSTPVGGGPTARWGKNVKRSTHIEHPVSQKPAPIAIATLAQARRPRNIAPIIAPGKLSCHHPPRRSPGGSEGPQGGTRRDEVGTPDPGSGDGAGVARDRRCGLRRERFRRRSRPGRLRGVGAPAPSRWRDPGRDRSRQAGAHGGLRAPRRQRPVPLASLSKAITAACARASSRRGAFASTRVSRMSAVTS